MKTTFINLLGEEHPLCFSLSAVNEINDEFGSLSAMDYNNLSHLSKLLTILLKAGRRYYKASGREDELPKEIKGDVFDLMDATDPDSIAAIFAAINSDSEREVEARPPKNAETLTGDR